MAEKRLYRYRVLNVDGTVEQHQATMDVPPTLEQLRRIVEAHLDGDLEHVYVLDPDYPDRRSDMFVDETGHLKSLPRNESATALYRGATLRAQPKIRPESLPYIAGPAVLFDDVVWR
jgi:hypothetical protein